MIIFKKVRYKNFLSTGQQFIEIDLDKAPTTLVVGDNGSGKSTILDAMCFGLFSKPFRAIKKDNQMFDRLLERMYNDISVHELKILEDYSDLSAANVSDDVAEGSEDTMKLVSNYVDQLELDLDKERLKVMIKEMYIEAQDSNIPIK